MKGFLKNVMMLIVVFSVALSFQVRADDIAKTRFGVVFSEFSEPAENFTIRFKDETLLENKDFHSAEVFGIRTLQEKDYVVLGLNMAGNCCPWSHIMILEVSATHAKIYDTQEAIYFESQPKIQVKNNGFEVVLPNVVDNASGDDLKFIVRGGKLEGPIEVKKVIKAFSAKDCESLFNVYSSECSGELYSGEECDRAALMQNQEVVFLTEKNKSDSTLFYDICHNSCGAKETKSLKDFSLNVCKVTKK